MYNLKLFIWTSLWGCPVLSYSIPLLVRFGTMTKAKCTREKWSELTLALHPHLFKCMFFSLVLALFNFTLASCLPNWCSHHLVPVKSQWTLGNTFLIVLNERAAWAHMWAGWLYTDSHQTKILGYQITRLHPSFQYLKTLPPLWKRVITLKIQHCKEGP